MQSVTCTFVVPCFNEAARLPVAELEDFALEHGDQIALLFVNDGSRDDTSTVLSKLVSTAPHRLSVLELPANKGKAEAVRTGLAHALVQGVDSVGYLDADLATPLGEVLRLRQELEGRRLDVVLGSRVALHGFDIQRSSARHYLGRVFATLASGVLRWRIYDTQCGAKIFRSTPALTAALQQPFISKWGFDIELLGRLVIGAPGVPPVSLENIAEMPLRVWKDVPGSKIQPLAMGSTVLQLARIELDLRRRRRLLLQP